MSAFFAIGGSQAGPSELPYSMIYQFITGPECPLAIPAGLLFPSGRSAGSLSENSILNEWIENSFKQQYARKDGSLSRLIVVEAKFGDRLHQLHHAVNAARKFPQAVFRFRLKPFVDPRRSEMAIVSAIGTGIGRSTGISFGFQLQLTGGVRILEIERLSSGHDRLLIVGEYGELMGPVPAAVRSAWDGTAG
jgi:hypothetical protein